MPQTDIAQEVAELQKLVAEAAIPEALRDKMNKMLMRLVRMAQVGGFSQEFELAEQYIRTAIQIPWGKYTQDVLDLTIAAQELNKTHYGLQHVKDTILEYLSVMKLQMDPSISARAAALPATIAVPVAAEAVSLSSAVVPTEAASANLSASTTTEATVAVPEVAAAETTASPAPEVTLESTPPAAATEMSRLQGSSSHAPVMCFVGIQGVGKTSIAKSIANALGRKFVRVSLGALGSVAQIRGIARTESGAEPGQIIKALIRTGSMNPVILLDEIDKTSSESGLRADLMAALLEILDPEQNSTFSDHYLDFPVDLSQVVFITTANNLGGISAALLDRLEILRFGSYSDDEKIHIAREYMLPKVREATGIGENQLTFDDEVWPLVVRPLGFDAGVRQLERTVTILARKVARMIVEGKVQQVHLTSENFRQFIPEDIGVYS
jgi:ATP-dependent Lon protease